MAEDNILFTNPLVGKGLRVIYNSDLLGVDYCVNFPVHAIMKKWVHNPLLNISFYAKVYQIASMDASA